MERMRGQENHHGFTLLELLVSSAIFGIVLVGIYTTYSASHTTTVRGENRAGLQQNARVGMEMMAREVRMAGYDPSGAIPAQPVGQQTAIQVADANTLTFIADVDGDNNGDPLPDTDWVRYRLQESQLFRDSSYWAGAWTPPAAPLPNPPPNPGVLADSVRPDTTPNPPGPGLAFQYFDANNVEFTVLPVAAANLPNIRRITITLTTQGTAGGRVESFPVTMDVRLRN